MSFEMIIGLEVSNQESYQAYREGMLPILKKFGGVFRYDFTVDQVLKAEVLHPINRLFAIYFTDKERSEKFFQDSDYLKVRKEFFEPAVKNIVVIAEYERARSEI